MKLSEEKVFLYAMMRDLTSERRRLTDMYFGLKERLDELNRLETKGLEDLSLKGYVDLYNEYNRETITQNIKRESDHLINKVNNVEEERLKKQEQQELELETNVKPDVIPKTEILRERSKDGKITKRKAYLNIEKVSGLISSVLKEKGIPMKVKDIYAEVNEISEIDIQLNNFRNNLMPKSMVKNKKIERVGNGMYQYRF